MQSEKISQIMKDKGLSAYQLWKMTGISKCVLSYILKKPGYDPKTSTTLKLSKALGVKVEDIV